MKHSGEIIFPINNKVIGHVDKNQDEYIIRFIEPVSKFMH